MELFSNYLDLFVFIVILLVVFFVWNKINTNRVNKHIDEVFLKLREEQAYEKYAKMETGELIKKYKEFGKYKNLKASKDYLKSTEPIIRFEMIEEILKIRKIDISVKKNNDF